MNLRTPLLVALGGALVACASGGAPPLASPAPAAELDLETARRLLSQWVEDERAAAGLGPVTWDAAAGDAAQRHAEDMARHGFAAHVGTDGSVPEQRYTRAGGAHAVMENVGCVADGRPRALEATPRFSPDEIRDLHRAFMEAGAPGGAHRRNVLSPWHGGVGVGLSRPEGVARACVAVVLSAGTGTLAPITKEAKLGDELEVAGVVAPPARAAYVSVARLPDRGRPTAAVLNQTGAYTPASPFVAVRTREDDKAPGAFLSRVVLDDARTPGTYGVGVWALFPAQEEPVLISLRTVTVR